MGNDSPQNSNPQVSEDLLAQLDAMEGSQIDSEIMMRLYEQSLQDLGTGAYIAKLVGGNLPNALIPAMLFLAGALISFSTGTSWGTFAILIPIGMPLAIALDLPPSLLLAAILGGGVFGDHCSPISDTTVVSSIAAGCDLLEHVRTQLPYAITGGIIAFVMYLIAGILIL